MAKIRHIYPSIPHKGSGLDMQVETDIHYKGYLRRQSHDIEAFKRDEELIIPDTINYESLNGLSNEVRDKLLK